MKKLIFFIFVFSFSICSRGQLVKNEIIGRWKVNNTIKKSSNPELRGVMDGFKRATFSFLENGDFELNTESKAPTFQMILRMTENAKWKFNPEEQLIKIGTEEDGYSIMGIYPERKGTTLIFSLDESEMAFEMERVP